MISPHSPALRAPPLHLNSCSYNQTDHWGNIIDYVFISFWCFCQYCSQNCASCQDVPALLLSCLFQSLCHSRHLCPMLSLYVCVFVGVMYVLSPSFYIDFKWFVRPILKMHSLYYKMLWISLLLFFFIYFELLFF